MSHCAGWMQPPSTVSELSKERETKETSQPHGFFFFFFQQTTRSHSQQSKLLWAKLCLGRRHTFVGDLWSTAFSVGLDLADPHGCQLPRVRQQWGDLWMQCLADLPTAQGCLCCLIQYPVFFFGWWGVAVGGSSNYFLQICSLLAEAFKCYKCLFPRQSPLLRIKFTKTSTAIPFFCLNYGKLHLRKKQSCS